MNNFLSIILMGQPQQGNNPMSTIFLMVMLIVVFYFFMIRPQVKRQKDLKNFRESLQKGDKIITTGGIYGKINNISGNVVTIDLGNNVIIKVDKSALLKDTTDFQSEQK
jgi:preprotein translocase subunit YajC